MTIVRGSSVVRSPSRSQLVLTRLPQLDSFGPLLAYSHEYPRNGLLSMALVLVRESVLAPTLAGIPSRRAGKPAWVMPLARSDDTRWHCSWSSGTWNDRATSPNSYSERPVGHVIDMPLW